MAAKSADFDIVQCNFKTVSNYQDPCDMNLYNVLDVREITKLQALNERLYKVLVWGKIFSAHLFADFRFTEGIIYEDDDSYYVLVYKAKKIALLNETLYYYVKTENSVMRNQDHLKRIDFIKIYQRRIAFFQEQQEDELVAGSYLCFCITLLLFYANRKKDKKNENNLSQILQLYKEHYLLLKEADVAKKKERVIFWLFKKWPNFVSLCINIFHKC